MRRLLPAEEADGEEPSSFVTNRRMIDRLFGPGSIKTVSTLRQALEVRILKEGNSFPGLHCWYGGYLDGPYQDHCGQLGSA